MRLVIEREGGFSIVEDADAITEIDVRSDAVVLTIEVGGDKWTKSLPVADHAEACRVSAAIAQKCGTLVEPLSEGPEVDGEEAMGAASAALVRKNSKPWKSASEWVEGEPPRDGRWYVSNYGLYCVRLVRWSNAKGGWEDSTMSLFGGSGPLAHVPTPIPDAPPCT